MSDWLQALKPGDIVGYKSAPYYAPDAVTITRLTATQIVLGNGMRFRRSSGRAVGDFGRMGAPYIVQMTDADREEAEKRRLASLIAQRAERKALLRMSSEHLRRILAAFTAAKP